MALVCSGCRNEIIDRRFLTCSICQENYDLECANVTEKRFYNTMSKEHKKSWKCDYCRSNEPKTDNTNTPIRPLQHNLDSLHRNQESLPFDSQTSQMDFNITLRKKKPYCGEALSTSDDELTPSPQGNTPPHMDKSEGDELISLQKFTSILQENNKHILSSIQASFRKEIENALSEIKTNFKLSFEKISTEQQCIQKEITYLNTKIKQLEVKYTRVQDEHRKLQSDIQNLNTIQPVIQPNYEDRGKILVLHGLTENYWETNEEVIERIINIFHDILNINLSGYIEEISFIGKKGRRRPLKIELISKRMKKHILDNSIYFRETGLSVTDYLSPSALLERKKLNQALVSARRTGHHAIIRNNKLIINGKVIIIPETKTPYNPQTQENKEDPETTEISLTCTQPSLVSTPPSPSSQAFNKKQNDLNEEEKLPKITRKYTFRK